MALVTDIFSGIVVHTDNVALMRLASLVGTKLVFGTDANNTVISIMSKTLSPLYMGILFLIIGWIAVGGTVKSAIDGTFLGQDWHSLGVPASLVMSIVLLAPVPTQDGISFAQVLFIKAVTIGSNFGDVMLRTASEASNTQAIQGLDPNRQMKMKNALISQVNGRMVSYLPVYLCAEQLVASGYNSQFTFFKSLTSMCKVPIGAETRIYPPYYKYKQIVPKADGSFDAVSLNPPQPQPLTPQTQTDVNEYTCYYEAFRNTFNTTAGIPLALRNTLQLRDHGGAIETPTAYPYSWAGGLSNVPTPTLGIAENSSGPAGEKRAKALTQVDFDEKMLIAGWPEAVLSASECIQRKTNLNQGFVAYWNNLGTSNPAVATPWMYGWAMAADYVKQGIADGNKSPGTPQELNTEIIKPDLNIINSSGKGQALKGSIAYILGKTTVVSPKLNDMMVRIQASVSESFDSTPIVETDISGNEIRTQAPSSNSAVPGHGDYTDARRIAVVGAETGLLLTTANPVARANIVREVGNFVGIGKGGGILDKITKATAEGATDVVTKGVGKNLKSLGRMAKGIQTFFSKVLMSREIAKEVEEGAKGIPIVGGVIAGVIGAGVSVVSKIFLLPGATTMLLFALTLLNIMTLAPEISMAIVLMLWLLRVAAWYLVVPISALLIALPKSNIGHSAWKEGLALALTPAFTMIFYIVSLLMFDIVIDVSASAMFAPYFDGSLGNTFFSIVGDILSGEILFRLFAFVGLVSTGFFFCVFLIIRGPGWAFGKLGFNTQDSFDGDSRNFEGAISAPTAVVKKAIGGI